jgi:hypothetical protein
MKAEFLEIAENLKNDHISFREAKNQVLILFGRQRTSEMDDKGYFRCDNCDNCGSTHELKTWIPTDFESWHETHYEIASYFSDIFFDTCKQEIAENYANQGTGYLYELAKDLTNKFEEIHKDRVWDGEFIDEIDEFLYKELFD